MNGQYMQTFDNLLTTRKKKSSIFQAPRLPYLLYSPKIAKEMILELALNTFVNKLSCTTRKVKLCVHNEPRRSSLQCTILIENSVQNGTSTPLRAGAIYM